MCAGPLARDATCAMQSTIDRSSTLTEANGRGEGKPARLQCGALDAMACATGAGAITVAPTTGGMILSRGDGSIPSRTFRLPAGYSVGDACCTPECCQ